MTLVLECSDLKTKLRKVDADLTEAVMELAREAFEKGYDVSIVRDVYGLLVPLEDPESEELRVELNKSFASFFQGINPARKHYVWHIPCVSIYVGREGPDGIEPEYWFHVMEYGDGEDALAKAIRSRPNLGANGVDIANVLVAELEAWKKLSEEAKWADEIARKIKKQEEKLTNLIGMALSPFREDAKVVWINGVPILVGETIRHYHVVCPLEKSKLDLKLVKAYWRRLLPYVDRDIRDEFRAVGELCASFRFLDELADKPLVAQRPRCCCFDSAWRLRPVEVISVGIVAEPVPLVYASVEIDDDNNYWFFLSMLDINVMWAVCRSVPLGHLRHLCPSGTSSLHSSGGVQGERKLPTS